VIAHNIDEIAKLLPE